MMVLRIVGSPLGDPDKHDGRYVSAYNPHLGRHGDIKTVPDIADALHFEDTAEALAFSRQVNRTHPMRPDGKPNRPLTAFTVEVAKVE